MARHRCVPAGGKSEVGVGEKAIVSRGGGEADSGGGVAFREPVGEFDAETRLAFDEGGRVLHRGLGVRRR